MDPYFQKFKGVDGEWYFRLRAANNETVASGEGYTSEASVDRAIKMVKDFGKALAAAEVKPASIARMAMKKQRVDFSVVALGQYLLDAAKKIVE